MLKMIKLKSSNLLIICSLLFSFGFSELVVIPYPGADPTDANKYRIFKLNSSGTMQGLETITTNATANLLFSNTDTFSGQYLTLQKTEYNAGVNSIYNNPNPASRVTKVHFSKSGSTNTISIYSLSGNRIYQKDIGYLSDGEYVWEIDVGGFSSYSYILRLENKHSEQICWYYIFGRYCYDEDRYEEKASQIMVVWH